MTRFTWMASLILIAVGLPWNVHGESKPVVAVFDVEVKGAELSKEELDRLSDFLASQIAETGVFQVVPRSQLRERLTQQKEQSHKQCYDQACQVELGRELAAEKSISTQVIKLGSQCAVTATLYDLRKSASDRAATVQGGCDLDGIVGNLEIAARRLAGKDKANPDKPVVAERVNRDSDMPGMVKVEAGAFWMGCKPDTDPQCQEDERPGRKVLLKAYYLDRTEVTVGQYEQCVRAGKCAAVTMHRECKKLKLCPKVQFQEKDFNWGQKERENHPANGVNWNQARAYCLWAGKRLPTEAEWEKAARGTDGRAYPWGNQTPTCDRAILAASGRGCGMESTWPVCSREQGQSPLGVCDLAGNVSEWVDDSYDKEYYGKAPEKDPHRTAVDTNRVTRGGSFADPVASLRASGRDPLWSGAWSATLGFRCARDGK